MLSVASIFESSYLRWGKGVEAWLCLEPDDNVMTNHVIQLNSGKMYVIANTT